MLMEKRIAHLILIVVVFLCSVACVLPNLDTENFAKEEPAHADLVGTYALTPSTVQFLKDEGGYEAVGASIALAADGTFEMVDMPDWWGAGEPGGGFDSGSGTWKTVKHQEWWDVELHFTSEDPPVGTTSIPIAGQAPPYSLWFYIGDPDSGDIIIFERVTSEMSP